MFNLNVGDDIDVFYNSIVIVKPKGFKLDSNFLEKEFALIMELEEKRETKKEDQQCKNCVQWSGTCKLGRVNRIAASEACEDFKPRGGE
jgi:hypothetical protein